MTREILLSSGRGIALVDDVDYEWLSRWRWNLHASGYACRTAWRGRKRYTIWMHREIVKPPDGTQVDHINRSRRDNRRANLRVVDNRLNARNRGVNPKSASGIRGVKRLKSGRWQAQSTHRQRCFYLGTFDTPEDAAAAYAAFNARIMRGEEPVATTRSSASRSGSRGVYQTPNGRWRTAAYHHGRCVSLGTHDTIEQAEAAYSFFRDHIERGEVPAGPAQQWVTGRKRGPSKGNKSGYRGVHRTRNGRWRAETTHQRKKVSLGTYVLLEDAVAAYEQFTTKVLSTDANELTQ